MTTDQVVKQISDIASLMGLLLALVTLFTSELQRRFQEESTHVGGSRRSVRVQIGATALVLAVTTIGAIVASSPLIRPAIERFGSPEWQPAFGVFVLVIGLLLGLVVWQLGIVIAALRPRATHR